MKKIVIKRSKWVRGTGEGTTQLIPTIDGTRNRNGEMCCLGHVRCQLGIRNKSGADSPRECPSKKWPKKLQNVIIGARIMPTNSDLAFRLMELNDDETITNSDRETRLISYFKEAGLNVTFVD